VVSTAAKKIVNRHSDQSESPAMGKNIAPAAANNMNAVRRGLFALSANHPRMRVKAMPRNA
jgi:hypothetical protein